MGIKRRQVLGLAATAAGASLLAACDGDKPVAALDPRFPIGPFGADSTAEDVTAGLDLSGRTALVTGCTSGLGYETMRVLALRGGRVFGTARTTEKATTALAALGGNPAGFECELSDPVSVRGCVAAVVGALKNDRIDGLMRSGAVAAATGIALVTAWPIIARRQGAWVSSSGAPGSLPIAVGYSRTSAP